MKIKLLTATLLLIASSAHAESQKIPFQIATRNTGIFPAAIDVLVQKVASELVSDEIRKYCGDKPRVTDLQYNTVIEHNEAPSATITITGSGYCIISN